MDDLRMVHVQIADHIARVTMDNPPVSAQNADLQDEMLRAFDRQRGWRNSGASWASSVT